MQAIESLAAPLVELGESIPTRFARVVAKHPARIAVSDRERQWTYAELDQRSDATARILLEHANAPRVVAVLMEHGAPMIAAILGVLKAGALYLAIDPEDPKAFQKTLLADSGTNVLLVDRVHAPLARSLDADVRVIDIEDDLGDSGGAAGLARVEPVAGAWLMYTSGSSGRSKGVWQNQAGVVHQADVFAELIGIQPEDRLSLLTSFNLAASATALFGALLNGATLCPFHLRARGVDPLGEWLRREQISIYHSVPTVFRHLMRSVANANSFEAIRWVRLGGEPVLASDLDLFRKHCSRDAQLLHAYSSTETGLVSALTLDTDAKFHGRVPVGKPVRGAIVSLLNESGDVAAGDAEGRIAVSGPGIARGYWRDAQATDAAFRSFNGKRRFVSSDLGRFLPDGTLEHLGRTDNVVKVRGRRVDLAEIEAALENVDSIRESAVAASAIEGERRLVAYVVFKEQPIDSSVLRQQLRAQLPEPLIPSQFVSMVSLPQTTGGKIDRKALPQPKALRADSTSRPMPRDGIERKLAGIWESVLGIEAVGRRENFFEVGGTSLHSAQVVSRIEQTFNATLPLSILVECGTVELLAQALARQTIVASASPLVRLTEGGPGLPLFLVHNGKGDVSTYGQLARRLVGRPVYALQSPGLDGGVWPVSCIRRMAQCYGDEIMRAHPSGPYLIGGTCMGGIVAFEIARQFAAVNRRIALLALIDSRLADRTPFEFFRNEARDLLRIPRWLLMRALGRTHHVRSLPGYRRFVANMNSRALRRYRPEWYSGKVTVIASSDTPQPKGDRRFVIRNFARKAEFISVPGTRAQLFMPPAVEELAHQLQSCIERAERVPTTGACAE